MRGIMMLIAVFFCWVMSLVWHSVQPDAVYMIKDLNKNNLKGDIENVLSANAPSGFWKIRSAVAVRSATQYNTFCVWYIMPYEPEFVWEELEKRKELKCK